MRICATVAEFNPFHNGHAYLINAFKHEYDATIAIMSGNYVQRGAPAIYDKFTRAKAAVANGVDLVIELPVIYALSSAETFAEGAIKTLNSLNCVDTLFFGSETGDVAPLLSVAKIALDESEFFKSLLKEKLAGGLAYPKALGEVYEAMGIEPEVVSSPNNILGIEYMKALLKTDSSITPQTLMRFGASHDSFVASHSIASASHIRSLIEKDSFTDNFMPSFPYKSPVFEKDFSDIILYALKSASYDDFIGISDCTNELASRFLSCCESVQIENIIQAVKSKNFTQSRIRRIIWNLIIKNNISPHQNPTYIRVLAQNKRGSEILSYMKKTASLPVIQKAAQLKDDKIFQAEVRATDIYNIIRCLPSGEDYRYSPIPI